MACDVVVLIEIRLQRNQQCAHSVCLCSPLQVVRSAPALLLQPLSHSLFFTIHPPPSTHLTHLPFSPTQINKNTLVLFDFWAEWCGPCKMVAPILEEIASENDGIVVAKLNVDENPQTAASYGITSIPTMNVYQGGQIVKTIIGAKPKAALLADLAPYLS